MDTIHRRIPRTPAGERSTGRGYAAAALVVALAVGTVACSGAAASAVGDTGGRCSAPAARAAGAADRTVRVDSSCDAFVADADRPVAPGTRSLRRRLPAELDRTFELESLPGSSHTLFLDFDGAVVTGTAWNRDYGAPELVAPPFSLTEPADTDFTPAELAAIQEAWQVVAEDFAAFDVNVTTRAPSADALARSSEQDPTWGFTVVATGAGGPLQQVCRCGGLAYLDVAGETGAERDQHQPGFVFGAVTSLGVGEAISHETGHMFGLLHDGTSTRTYYAGSDPWAPIMGTGYLEPLTQWSAGEYADANNQQDDVAIIASYAGLRGDDHADAPAGATPLPLSDRRSGVISSRTDVDVFAFKASGPVSVRVSVPGLKPDLDVAVRIVDAQGATIATVAEPTRVAAPPFADGLGASWRGRLPSTATYYVLVDGVGAGDPGSPGGYSDYGSLGSYTIRLRR